MPYGNKCWHDTKYQYDIQDTRLQCVMFSNQVSFAKEFGNEASRQASLAKKKSSVDSFMTCSRAFTSMLQKYHAGNL